VLLSYKRLSLSRSDSGMSIVQEGALMWKTMSPYYVCWNSAPLTAREVLDVLRHPAVANYEEVSSAKLYSIIIETNLRRPISRTACTWIVANYGVSRNEVESNRCSRPQENAGQDGPELTQAKEALENLSPDELRSMMLMLATFKKA
jgi:hypothetical protein